LEALHKQVLPFLLRRMKEDVLADLPPKIIQDYYCELSPLQKRLYEDFAKQQGNEIQQDTESKEGKQHIFQALQYMRKLCNHPGLVLQPKHPKYDEITSQLKHEGSSIWDIKNAPKLQALTELLIDCGITGGVLGAKSDVEALTSGSGVVSQHRALIFCQVREMIDRVEKDVLKAKLPGVTYLRLDGSVDPKDRFGIVEKFNADPTIDLLLLTTHVGGLGLNLTGADTVIFVEHDWNPMKDLQAMDRAHRIGQKRVVNVYRLITKDTLEEKIMGYCSLYHTLLTLQTTNVQIEHCLIDCESAERGLGDDEYRPDSRSIQCQSLGSLGGKGQRRPRDGD
jgi:TATA-binding protein-associated factor